jgi:putative ABC transport system permease protein
MLTELAMLAVHNLLRARARLFMTAGGVLVGTTAVVLLIALTIGLQNSAEAQIGADSSLTELTIYPSWSPKPDKKIPQLDIASVRAFTQLQGVQAVIPQYVFSSGGQLQANKLDNYAQIVGVDPRLVPYMGLTAQQGEILLQEGGALIGNQLPNNFYDPKSTDYQPITVDMFNTPTTLLMYNNLGSQRKVKLGITAILSPNPNYDYYILMPIKDVIAYTEWAQGSKIDLKKFTYNQVVIRTSGRETTQSVSDAVREMGYNVSGLGDYLNSINGFFSTLRVMLGGVGGVALLVAAFGVANTMTMAILERTREIGLMKAVGATDTNILTIFLVEAGLVGLIGGASGISVSLLLQRIINEAVMNQQPADPNNGGGAMFLPVDLSNLKDGLVVIPAELILFAMLLATSVGIIAGLYPALRAARMTTVVALKSD